MPFIVMEAAANMPASCWGRYKRIAVVHVESEGARPKMISERARSVREIVATWEKLNVGHTARCAYSRAMKEAREMCDALNAKEARSTMRAFDPSI